MKLRQITEELDKFDRFYSNERIASVIRKNCREFLIESKI